MTEHDTAASADAEGTRSQALVPYPLATSALKDNRARIVRDFKKWILEDGERADRELKGRELSAILRVSRNTLMRYFKAEECKGSPWHALCFMALEDYQEGVDPEPSPKLRHYHSEYQHWRAEAQRGGDGVPLSEFKLTDSDDLLKIIDAADASSDLLAVTTAARIYIKRVHERLVVNSMLGHRDSVLPRDEAVTAAESICEVAARVIDRLVWPKRADLPAQVRRNCAAIIDSTVDARRLLSRDAQRQGNELGLLVSLRHKDSDLTKAVRTEAARAMVQYNIDHTEALMDNNAATAAEKEMKATETLLETLAGIRAFALRDDVFRLSTGAPPNNAVPCLQIVEVAARLAGYMVAYSSPSTRVNASAREVKRRNEFSKQAKKCKKLLLQVLDPELDISVAQDRADVISLLTAARKPNFIVGPPRALRILRFRGIGEMLVARMLTTIATDDGPLYDREIAAIYLRETSASAAKDEQDTPQPIPVKEHRRTMLLERARSLYLRSIDWQRSAGAPKRLREQAGNELEGLQVELDRRTAPPSSHNEHESAPQSIEGTISRLRDDLDHMIVEGILWADLRQLNELPDESLLRARRLIGTMTEATRFLKEPEMGLRTDLAPTRSTIE